MSRIQPKLNRPQARFISLPHKFRAFVAGYGSGKTWVGCSSLCAHAWNAPKITSGYFGVTYPQIRDIFYPTIEEVSFTFGLTTKVRVGNKEVDYYSGRQYRGTTICRSMDNPNSIVGFKVGKSVADEIDTMRYEQALNSWRKIIARHRSKGNDDKYDDEAITKADEIEIIRNTNGIDVTTTPEGFKFTYKQFIEDLRLNSDLAKLYGIIQASTYDNAKNLPDGYIDSLRQSYPPQLIEAYLNGQFVNLESGSVWSGFDRKLNHTDVVMAEGEPLHIGMDFNVLKMAAVIYVIRDDRTYAVDELTDVRDTPTMAQLLKERYAGKHAMTIYPDASGQNTSSKEASQSDLSILRQYGFRLRVDTTNPSIKDRVNATNAMLCNGIGERRMFVNTHRCPEFTNGLEQQIYDKNGMPDKTSGVDHVTDAGTYPIVKLYPIPGRYNLKNL